MHSLCSFVLLLKRKNVWKIFGINKKNSIFADEKIKLDYRTVKIKHHE